MSLQTKRKVAQALSVPLFYIKSKTPRQLLTLYKRCTKGSLPFPSMRKQTFNGKIFLVPNTPLGRKTYARVILTPSPLMTDLIIAASKMGIKGAKRMKKDIIKHAILNKFVKLKIPEPVLFATSRKPKTVIKFEQQPLRRVPEVFKNDIKIRKEINNLNKSSNARYNFIKQMFPGSRNRTTTVRYISSKQNMSPKIPPRPKVPVNRNRTTTVRYVSNKRNMAPRLPSRPKVPMGPFITTPQTPSSRPRPPLLPSRPNRPNVPRPPLLPSRPNRPNVPRPPLLPSRPNRPNVPKPPLPPSRPNRPNVPRPPLPPSRPNKPNFPNVPSVPNVPPKPPNVPSVPNVPPKPPNVPKVPNTPGPVVIPIPSENRKLNTNALRQRIGKHQLKINNLKAKINQKNSV